MKATLQPNDRASAALMKTCPICKTEKPLSSFRQLRGTRFKYYDSYCRICDNRQAAERRQRNPEKYRKLRRKWRIKRYGIDQTKFDEMLKIQNGKCKLCKKAKHTSERPLHIEHDHKTNRVRGLTCRRCNLLIAAIENNPELIQRTIQYLAETSKLQNQLFIEENNEPREHARLRRACKDAEQGNLRFSPNCCEGKISYK